MEVWDVAHAFGMNVKEFCSFFGYSRPAMYIKTGGRRRERVEEGMKRLYKKSDEMFEADVAMARSNYEKRSLAICDFEKNFMSVRYNNDCT